MNGKIVMKDAAVAKRPMAGNRTCAVIVAAFLGVGALGLGLTGCDSNDGPMEKAGKSIDEKATNAGNKIEDKCEEAKDSLGMKDTRC